MKYKVFISLLIRYYIILEFFKFVNTFFQILWIFMYFYVFQSIFNTFYSTLNVIIPRLY